MMLTTPRTHRVQRQRMAELYRSARTIAAQVLRVRSGGSWCRTDLANEALARLLGGPWADRVRADPDETVRALRTVMRRTLIDYERGRRRARRPSGAGRERVAWTEGCQANAEHDDLDWAIQQQWLLDGVRRGVTELRLARPDKVVEVAELCLVLGLTHREAAEHAGVPKSTVSHWMRMVRAWMRERAHDAQ